MASYTKKITVTLPNGTTTKTYYSNSAPDETTPGEKRFTGIRAGETGDGSIVVYKDKILDQKVEDGTFTV